MTQTLIEYLREASVKQLFEIGSFQKVWPVWKPIIKGYLPTISAKNIFNLGDHLGDIFGSTGNSGRDQSSLAGGGNAWEALICWYLNLCLLESRTVVIKYKKNLIPTPIHEAISVNYGNVSANTESDLIAIMFPQKEEYTSLDKSKIRIASFDGGGIVATNTRKGEFNYKEIVDNLLERDFNDCELGVIQCKTNWNDNAQIPMLWDMIYSSLGFSRNLISVGNSTFSIRNLKRFTYSFVTVPTSRGPFNPNSMPVKRVHNISGGNYWGRPSKANVASSIKEIFGRNFSNSHSNGLRMSLTSSISKLDSHYEYFQLL